jgi:uncharacterized membrane protein
MASSAYYLLAALVLFASHAIPSWPGVRKALMARLGRAGFMAFHSVLSAAALALFVHAWRGAGAMDGLVFQPVPAAAPLAVALMPVAFILVALRLTTPFGTACGVYRLVRFPGSLGLLLWSVLHILATGDIRRVILFATMAAMALFAMVKNGWVLRRDGGIGAAVPAGGLCQAWREIGWWRPLAGLAAWGLVLASHATIFGVDPLYWWM